MDLRRAAAPALLATLALLAGGCGVLDDDPSPTASEQKTRKPRGGSDPSATTPTAGESSAPTEPSGNTTTVPAYFVGETPQGPRLYREFRKVDAAAELEGAAALVTSGKTLDPDYRTLYPGGAFASVTYDEAAGEIVAEVPDDGWTTPAEGMSSDDAELAVQQLVYTLQGVVQSRAPLVVTLGGEPTSLFGVDTSGGVANADPLETLALVNVTYPEEGSTVDDVFPASGVASSFEANVPWAIRQDGEVVLDGFATAEGWMEKLYPWEASIDVSMLPPGVYEFVARTDDPSGGEGSGPTEDTKTFTIPERD